MEKRRWSNVKVFHVQGRFEEPVHVATVQVDRREWESEFEALDFAFMRTNSIDTPWFAVPASGVAVAEDAARGCRSSSVGDLFALDGDVYAVKSIGWMRIS